MAGRVAGAFSFSIFVFGGLGCGGGGEGGVRLNLEGADGGVEVFEGGGGAVAGCAAGYGDGCF